MYARSKQKYFKMHEVILYYQRIFEFNAQNLQSQFRIYLTALLLLLLFVVFITI